MSRCRLTEVGNDWCRSPKGISLQMKTFQESLLASVLENIPQLLCKYRCEVLIASFAFRKNSASKMQIGRTDDVYLVDVSWSFNVSNINGTLQSSLYCLSLYTT